jgi:arylsulfatase A-like enzyme
MKKCLLLLMTIMVLLMLPFVTLSYAAIGDYDFSSPKDGDVDGKDLAVLIASPGPDVTSFAGFFGQTYTVTMRLPNILLIIGDDQGLDAHSNLYPGLISGLVTKYSNSNVQGYPASVPNLTNRLATQGMVFSNAWAQPYCSPTRATVITGLFEDKTRVTGPDSPLKYNETNTTITFVRKLHDEANYSTAIIGKWHLAGSCGISSGCTGTLPKQAGFDYYRGHNAAYIPAYWSYPVHYQDSTTGAANNFGTIAAGSVTARSLPVGSTTPVIQSTKYEPVVRAADTIDWITARKNENPDKPWFVWLAFNLSHVTTQSPAMHVPNKDTLDSATIDLLGYPLPTTTGCLGSLGQYGSDSLGSGNPSVGNCTGPELHRAMTNAMDTVIGQVLDVVDTIGSDTYVIFIGDNGTPMYGTIGGVTGQIGNLYLDKTGRGKGSAWESGCRVPMAIRGPGIAAGAQKSAPVHVADLSATILMLAGLTPPAKNFDSEGHEVDSDSKSLTQILFGTANDTGRDPNEDYLLTETATAMFGTRFLGARNATYKVLCPYSLSSMSICDFYNLIDDPLEHNTALTKPTSCANYRSNYTTINPEWHFCRLWEVLNTYSILGTWTAP